MTLESNEALTEHELAELIYLANIGELAGPLSHEFNNFLNTTLLHVEVLESLVDEDLRTELAQIRSQARNMAAIVKQFQRGRRQRASAPVQADLNVAVRTSLIELKREAGESASAPVLQEIAAPLDKRCAAPESRIVPVVMELALHLPTVSASGPDLNRLCQFLLRNAASATLQVGGSILVCTELRAETVSVRVEDGGLSLEAERLSRYFELTDLGRSGVNRLELAACKSLVKRLHGRIDAADRPAGGVIVQVELPKYSAGAGS